MKEVSSEASVIQWLMDAGMLRRIDGGGLDKRGTHAGMSFGFLNGECLPELRSNIRSRKSTTFRLVFDRDLQAEGAEVPGYRSFLALSAIGAEMVCRMARPSTLYSPILGLRNVVGSVASTYMQTSLQNFRAVEAAHGDVKEA